MHLRILNILVTLFIITGNLFAQEEKIKDLILQGIAFNDQGNFKEAITKYNEALAIDPNSTVANYELSYTYMQIGQYEEAVRFSKTVIDQNADNQPEAYVVMGSSLDLFGKADLAVNAYEEGLANYPDSYLLNYNLALCLFNQKEYDKAETTTINAITLEPKHGSSHILLSYIMQAKGQRVKSILPIYYFLMIEPDSERSKQQYDRLIEQLGQGISPDNNNTISLLLPASSSDKDFGDAEVMISLLTASRYTDQNKKKSDLDYFIELNRELFEILGELKKNNKGFWWDIYVTPFYLIAESDDCEAFSYFISQSVDSEDVNNFISSNTDKILKFTDLLTKL
jgi:tetratricopeptide (TPR) repeat protein